MRRGALGALAVAAAVCAFAPVAGARPLKQYWYRVSHYELKAVSTAQGSETDASGRTTSGSVTKTAAIDYRGRRGDLAFFTERPRSGFPGQISMSHLVPMDIHQAGSWSERTQSETRSGTCHGDKRLRPFEPYSQIHRRGGTLRGEFRAPIVDDRFDDGCRLFADLDNPKFPWKLPVSDFHKRTVKIKLSHDLNDPGDISYAVHWTGTVTLKLLKVCRTTACVQTVH